MKNNAVFYRHTDMGDDEFFIICTRYEIPNGEFAGGTFLSFRNLELQTVQPHRLWAKSNLKTWTKLVEEPVDPTADPNVGIDHGPEE